MLLVVVLASLVGASPEMFWTRQFWNEDVHTYKWNMPPPTRGARSSSRTPGHDPPSLPAGQWSPSRSGLAIPAAFLQVPGKPSTQTCSRMP